jgi:hypothetical protein
MLNKILMKLFIRIGKRFFNQVKIEKNKNGIVLENFTDSRNANRP